jgi:hypothetical protein
LAYIVLNTSRMEVDWFVAIQRLDSAVNVDHFVCEPTPQARIF